MVKPKARKELLPASPLLHGGSVQLKGGRVWGGECGGLCWPVPLWTEGGGGGASQSLLVPAQGICGKGIVRARLLKWLLCKLFHGRPHSDPALFRFLMAQTQRAILRDLPVWENFSL